MAQIIKGADVAACIKERIRSVIHDEGLSPKLAIVKVGHNKSDEAYEKGILKTCADTGIEAQVFELPENINQAEFERRFMEVNDDPGVHGILLFRPLPKGLDEKKVSDMMNPDKDIDCMTGVNWAKLVTGQKGGYYPCTAESVIRICDHAGIKYDGAKAVVIGRSQVIGKPVGLMLLERNATVTWCHSRTKELARECTGADILVSACGRAQLIDENTVRGISKDSIAVDVGVNFKDGKMCGDFNFDQVGEYAAMITPVPGGVGAVTNSVLAAHVVMAAYKAKTGGHIAI